MDVVCVPGAIRRPPFRNFKKLTWDYPEGKWAKFVRGRLAEDAMVTVESQIENDQQ